MTIFKPKILALYMRKPWLKHTLGLAKIWNVWPLVLLVTRFEPWSLPNLHLKIDRNFRIEIALRYKSGLHQFLSSRPFIMGHRYIDKTGDIKKIITSKSNIGRSHKAFYVKFYNTPWINAFNNWKWKKHVQEFLQKMLKFR